MTPCARPCLVRARPTRGLPDFLDSPLPDTHASSLSLRDLIAHTHDAIDDGEHVSLRHSLASYLARGREGSAIPAGPTWRSVWYAFMCMKSTKDEDEDEVQMLVAPDLVNTRPEDEASRVKRAKYASGVHNVRGYHQLESGAVVHAVVVTAKTGEVTETKMTSIEEYLRFLKEMESLTTRDNIHTSPYDLAFYRKSAAANPFPFSRSELTSYTDSMIKDHQLEALYTVINQQHGRSLVTLAPGLGKTMIGCLFARHYFQGTRTDPVRNRVLVICPASKVKDWQNEYKQWTGSTKTVRAMSYDKARIRFETIRDVEWDAVVVDECHQLKNPQAKRTMLLGPFLAKQAHVLLLSGTPQPNRPMELFSLLQILDPKSFDARLTFYRWFCDADGGDEDERDAPRGSSHVDELQALMTLYTYRNDHAVATTTNLIRRYVEVEPTEDQAAELSGMREELGKRMSSFRSALDPASRERALKRVKDYVIFMWRETGKMKASSAMENIRSLLPGLCPSNKMVIFCHHTETVAKVVKEELERIPAVAGRVVYIDGGVPLNQRQELIERLKNPEDASALVGVLTTGSVGEGINLVPAVRTLVMLEMEHRPSAMLQAEKRIHRVGSVADASTYWMLMPNSIDETILENINDKLSGISKTVGGPGRVEFVNRGGEEEEEGDTFVYSSSSSVEEDELVVEEERGYEDVSEEDEDFED